MIVGLAGIAGLYGLAAIAMAFEEQTILTSDNLADLRRPEGSLPRLADLLTLVDRASIFYSYARETEMSVLFTQSVSEGEGTTVFVPTNKAVQALARKPHEGPDGSVVGVTGAEQDAISKYNVQRWVGAHIIPSPGVDFTNSTPYSTLTPGTTIAFSAISSHGRLPTHEPIIDTDAAHFSSVKGTSSPPGDFDSIRPAGVKGCGHARASNQLLEDPLNGPPDTDAAHFASIKGPAVPNHDAAHFSDVKGSSTRNPVWRQYELNHGVRIIWEKKASNGVMYLIDGTVPVIGD